MAVLVLAVDVVNQSLLPLFNVQVPEPSPTAALVKVKDVQPLSASQLAWHCWIEATLSVGVPPLLVPLEHLTVYLFPAALVEIALLEAGQKAWQISKL